MLHAMMPVASTARQSSQEDGIRLPHVAPINALVDDLRQWGRGWVPYVAPIYGGVNAQMLSVLRDPGPMTDSAGKGSGFLCLENDDAAASAPSAASVVTVNT